MGGRGMKHSYSFKKQQAWSHGKAINAGIESILLEQIPSAASVIVADPLADWNGTDYWVERRNGRPLSVDAKIRSSDWASKGKDDLALEVWSVVERRTPGWTLNTEKQTDYILWLWQDTGRWCLVPFPMLCRISQEHMEHWCRRYQTARQFTPDGNYHSECVFVPRKTVWRELQTRYGGEPKAV